jgi:hypothetical protein
MKAKTTSPDAPLVQRQPLANANVVGHRLRAHQERDTHT